MERRTFLKVVGASTAASTACGGIDFERLVGDVPIRPAPSLRPGAESYVDTICGACPAGCGIRVRVVDGAAVGIQGLKDHPVNDGGVCPRGAAEVQNLYHPERLTQVLARSEGGLAEVSWDEALDVAAEAWRAAQADRRGVLIVLGSSVSPAEVEVALRVARAFPPAGGGVVRLSMPMYEFPEDAFRLMLGTTGLRYDFPRAQYILTVQSDWLQASPSPVEMQRAYAELRQARPDRRVRMIHAGSRLSMTALKADRWISIRPEGGAAFAHSVAAALMEKGLYDPKAESLRGFKSYRDGVLARFGGDRLGVECGVLPDAVREVAEEFGSRRGAIAVGRRAVLAEQCAVIALNLLSGSVGVPGGIVPVARVPFRSVDFSGVPLAHEYFAAMGVGRRRPPAVVIFYKANPLHASADGQAWTGLLSGEAVRKFAIGSLEDESARISDVVLPASTSLESSAFHWGTAFTGEPVLSAGPAVVAPLPNSREGLDILLDLAGRAGVDLHWKNADDFRKRLLIEVDAESLAVKGGTWAFPAGPSGPVGPGRFVGLFPASSPDVEAGRHLILETYPLLAFPYGEGAHLPYLHGLTSAAGRETWSSWIEIHPDAAEARGIRDGDRAEVRSELGHVVAVARITRGIHPSAVAMPLGLGRKALGEFADGHGVDPAALLTPSPGPGTHGDTWEGTRVEVRKI